MTPTPTAAPTPATTPLELARELQKGENTKAYVLEVARRYAKRLIDAQEQPPQPPLAALTLREFFDRPTPQCLIDQVIPDKGLVELVGAPGVLKTFLAAAAGLSVASGQSHFFGYPILRHGPVLYIAAEGVGAFPFRIRAWCHEHDVDPLAIAFSVVPMPVNLRDEKKQKELLAIVTTMQPILIIFDTLSRCTPGAEENSARDMSEVVNYCSQLQQPSGAAIIFVHHPPKADPRGGGRGSGVMSGAVDTEIRVTTDDEGDDVQGERLITVSCTKQKDDQAFAPMTLVGVVVPVRDLQGREMTHDSGRPITSLVLRLADRDDLARQTERAAQTEHDMDRKVLQAMHDFPAATSQKKLRDCLGGNQGAVTESINRILGRGWAVSGGRGEPYTITDEGKGMLAVPF